MQAHAIDSYSVRNEELEKYKLYFYKENKKWIDSQMQVAGLGVTEPAFMPQNLDELELWAANGGFKAAYTVSIEDLLKHTFEISDWDKEIAEKVKQACALLSEAEDIADKAGITFSWDGPGYGMGGYYSPKGEDWTESSAECGDSDGGRSSSSSNC